MAEKSKPEVLAEQAVGVRLSSPAMPRLRDSRGVVDPRVRHALIVAALLLGAVAIVTEAWWLLLSMVAVLIGQVYELRHQRGRS